MKIAIIGGTESAFKLAKLLVNSEMELAIFIIQAPDPHEDKASFNATIDFLKKKNIAYEISNRFTDEIANLLIENKVTVGCLINCRFLIPEKFLNLLPDGFFVTHGSILPEYRGFAPLNWAIINRKDKVGLTLFKAAAKVDSGPVILTREFFIDATTTAGDIFKLFAENQPMMFVEALTMLQQKTPSIGHTKSQSESEATYCCRRVPSDCEIDWKKNSTEVIALLRASQPPYPYAYTYYKGEIISIVQAQLITKGKKFVGIIPGRIAEISRAEGWVDVLCSDGPLRINKILYSGKEQYPSDVIKSLAVTLGMNYSEEIVKLKKEISELKKIISLNQN